MIPASNDTTPARTDIDRRIKEKMYVTDGSGDEPK